MKVDGIVVSGLVRGVGAVVSICVGNGVENGVGDKVGK